MLHYIVRNAAKFGFRSNCACGRIRRERTGGRCRSMKWPCDRSCRPATQIRLKTRIELLIPCIGELNQDKMQCLAGSALVWLQHFPGPILAEQKLQQRHQACHRGPHANKALIYNGSLLLRLVLRFLCTSPRNKTRQLPRISRFNFHQQYQLTLNVANVQSHSSFLATNTCSIP